ncbi:aspartate aminotransferase family protein [Mycobacterium sp. 141]|uniref:aspartate aminotransferase family protein n=1 Tax=Mycobacterium sp. 141 TaxID=1120797 RepID=UPI00039E8418|nr:aspartate aminotransferase family protein [Mycobacterium sp. 141]
MEINDMSTEDAVKLDSKHVIHGWGYDPLVLVEGHGSIVVDNEGREYIDCMSQAHVANIGHSHPRYVAAVKDQVERISHVQTWHVSIPRAELARKVADIAPGKMRNNCKIYFSCGGSEANETALKFAMVTTGKKQIVTTYYSYFGGTLALAGLADPGNTPGHAWFRERANTYPGISHIPAPYCYRCPFNLKPDSCDVECATYLDQHLTHSTAGDVAAFITEPIKSGVGGNIMPCRKEYWSIIQDICEKHGVLLIIDEVVSGMGRTGKVWSCELWGFEPDILTTAKPIGGGIPLGATIIRDDLVPSGLETEAWHHFTQGGSPIAAAAGIAVVDVMLEENLPAKAERQGDRMLKRLNELRDRHQLIGDVRGAGLLIALELVTDRNTKEPAVEQGRRVYEESMRNGVIFGHYPAGTIHIKPPLAISDDQADRVLEVLDNALTSAAR